MGLVPDQLSRVLQANVHVYSAWAAKRGLGYNNDYALSVIAAFTEHKERIIYIYIYIYTTELYFSVCL